MENKGVVGMPYTRNIMTKQIKQTGQDKVMEEFKAKKQNITIYYEDVPEKLFTDIKGYSLNGPYLVVQLHDDQQFVFPMANVSSLHLYITE